MKILIVNGAPRSGKDTFCEAAFYGRGLVYPISTIDRIKQIALFAGWSGEKDAKGRKLLSDIKDALTLYNDLPRNYVLDYIRTKTEQLDDTIMLGSDEAIFLVQSREPADIKRWVEENGAKALYITREDTEQHWGNHADDNGWDYNYDYFLENNDTELEWEEEAVRFIDMIRRENWESHI